MVTVGTAEENNPAVCVVAPNAKQTEVVTVGTAEGNNPAVCVVAHHMDGAGRWGTIGE